MSLSFTSRSARAGGAALLAALLGLACANDRAGAPGVSDVRLGERAAFDGLSYQVPASWTAERPSTSMRLAEYRIAAAAGDSDAGECSLFHFPGQGGTVEDNLQRWYGQFQQPDGGSTAERAEVERFTAGGLPVTFVRVAGTYAGGMGPMAGGASRPGYMLVAGVVETNGGSWFLKCTGPQATMTTATPEVRALLASVGP